MAENEHQTQAGSATRRDTDAPTPGNPFPTSDIAADTSDLPRLLAQARDRLADLLFEIDTSSSGQPAHPAGLQREDRLLRKRSSQGRNRGTTSQAKSSPSRKRRSTEGKASQIRPSRNNSKGEFAEWEAQLNVHVQDYLDALQQPRGLPCNERTRRSRAEEAAPHAHQAAPS